MIFEIPKKECCAETTFKNQDTMLLYLIEMIDVAYHFDTAYDDIEFKDNDFLSIQLLENIHAVMYKPVLPMLYYMMAGRVTQDVQDAFLHVLTIQAFDEYWQSEAIPTREEVEHILEAGGCPPLSVVNEMRKRHDMESFEEYAKKVL